ncbi:MAG: response regulator [Desulfovibrionaceae bacterium]
MADKSGQTILVVENSTVQARIISEHIQSCTSFPTRICASLADLQTILENGEESVFLAVLNLSLKDAPNGEAVDYILSKGVPCIVLTATFNTELRNRFLEKNVLDYFDKSNREDMDNMVDQIERLWSNRNCKVVIAEDSSTARRVMLRLLQQHNFTVLEAANGKEALEQLERHPDVKLLITDYEMGEMDGFELVSRVRETHSKETLAIIGVSAHSSGALTAKFLKNGANDFLNKPFEVEEFNCRVSKNLNEIDRIHAIKEAHQRDFLAPVFNRKYFIETGRELHNQAKAQGASLGLALFSIDGLGAVNAQYGLDAGDAALLRLAVCLDHHAGNWDIVARNANKFYVLTIRQGTEDFVQSLEAVRDEFAASPVRRHQTAFTVQASFVYSAKPYESLDAMLAALEG